MLVSVLSINQKEGLNTHLKPHRKKSTQIRVSENPCVHEEKKSQKKIKAGISAVTRGSRDRKLSCPSEVIFILTACLVT